MNLLQNVSNAWEVRQSLLLSPSADIYSEPHGAVHCDLLLVAGEVPASSSAAQEGNGRDEDTHWAPRRHVPFRAKSSFRA